MNQRLASPITVLSDREVTIAREFAAPPDQLFQAYTDPAIIPHWWGLRELRTTVEQLDARPGGSWRFIQTNPADGASHAFYGEFRAVVPGERLVNTWQFDGMPELVMVDDTRFEAIAGGTRITVMSSFDSTAYWDTMLELGLEGGANDLWDRLAELSAVS
jgi:uncharacterized protein YndB with AHSA1/START domain